MLQSFASESGLQSQTPVIAAGLASAEDLGEGSCADGAPGPR